MTKIGGNRMQKIDIKALMHVKACKDRLTL